jgi:hypothetical protein
VRGAAGVSGGRRVVCSTMATERRAGCAELDVCAAGECVDCGRRRRTAPRKCGGDSPYCVGRRVRGLPSDGDCGQGDAPFCDRGRDAAAGAKRTPSAWGAARGGVPGSRAARAAR